MTGITRRPGLWLLAALLAAITLVHHREALQHPGFLIWGMAALGLERHAFERVLFLAPIVWAGFLYGSRGAFITSLVALASMLPRAVLTSPYPKDALFETASVFVVGNLVAASFEALRRERERRVQLAALNQITSVVSQSMELGPVLKSGIATVKEVTRVDAVLVFLVDEKAGRLNFAAYQGVSPRFAEDVRSLKIGEGFNGRVAATGETLFVEDASAEPSLTRAAVRQEGIRSQLIVPLRSKGKVVGTLCAAMRSRRRFRQDEVALLTAIGNQVGVAIENARLYEQQRDAENRYRTIFETTGTASMIVEEDTTISLANKEFEKLSGYSREEVEGKRSWTEFVAMNDLGRTKEYHRLRGVAPDAAPNGYEFRFADRWGNVKDVFLTIAVIPGTKKSVASLSDVTGLKQAERELRAALSEKEASEQRYRELFEGANDAIWLHDLQENILAANEACARLTGYALEELHGIRARDLIAEGCVDRIKDTEDALLSGQTRDQLSEVTLVRKDRSEASVQLSTSPILSNGEIVAFQHIARDVTEEERLKESMRYYLQQTTRAQEEERRRIARELHDDTIQALVVLSRQLEEIASNRKRLSRETRLHLEGMREQANNIMDGVRRLSQDLRPPTLDRLGFLKALQGLAVDVAGRTGIVIEVRVQGEERRLDAEAELLLFRIAQEAIRNVWRHSQATQAEVVVEFGEGETRVAVSDNGKGFELSGPVSDLAREGKLGLAGMQERARLLGGELSVRSEPGRGTTVAVSVPR